MPSNRTPADPRRAPLPPAAFDAFYAAARELDYTGYAEQYPPFAAWRDFEGRAAAMLKAWRAGLRLADETGLFVNVPFCRSKCSFCFLPVTAIGSSGRARELFFRQYLEALDKEASFYAPALKRARITTLYIGGGTPSLMEPAQLRTFFGLLRRHFPLAAGCQVVLEVHPDDLTDAKLSAYEEFGVGRVCIGVQSLDTAVLDRNRRRQGLGGAAEACAALRRHGISGINIDLICGLPGQRPASFLRDLRAVIALRPDQVHLNTFINTPYTIYARTGGLVRDEGAAESTRQAGFALLRRAGYMRVDSDSMGLTPGSRNLQTSGLDGRRSILGLGPGAVSHVFGAMRSINRVNWDSYRRTAAKGLPPADRGIMLTPRDEMIYYAISRFTEDLEIDLDGFRRTHGIGFSEAFPRELELLEENGARVTNGKIPAGKGIWSLARRIFYSPEVTALALKNISVSRRKAARRAGPGGRA